MYFDSITFILSLIVSINIVYGKYTTCPVEDFPIGSPCYYRDDQTNCNIVCEGDKTFNIKATLAELNHRLPIDKKQFHYLTLWNPVIKELPANAFGGLQFSIIFIKGANYLTSINIAAFDGTISTLTELAIEDTAITETVTNGSDLFGAIDTLKGLESLLLRRTGVTALPSNCLSGLNNLRYVQIDNNPLRAIFANAFNNLPSLKELHFWSSPIGRVAEHAYTVGRNITAQQLEITFLPQLKDPFNNRTFESIGCPTTIHLGVFSMKYLDRNIFEIFLNDNTLNVVFDDSIDCADSRNQWIKEKYPHEWDDLKCK